MGLSNYPSVAEGVIPLIVMNTVMSVALLKNMFRSVLEAIGATSTTAPTTTSTTTYYYPSTVSDTTCVSSRPKIVSITQYKSLCQNRSSTINSSKSSSSNSNGRESNNSGVLVECCVCLTGFEANQEVSELPCKHFFHRGCLEKWFDNWHKTCPLCRSLY